MIIINIDVTLKKRSFRSLVILLIVKVVETNKKRVCYNPGFFVI